MTADSLAAFLEARWAEIETKANGEHIALHDPAYVLADVEAKRRIVELYKEERSRVLAYRSPRWKDAMNEQDKSRRLATEWPRTSHSPSRSRSPATPTFSRSGSGRTGEPARA